LVDGRRTGSSGGDVDIGPGAVDHRVGPGCGGQGEYLIVRGPSLAIGPQPGDTVIRGVLSRHWVEPVALEGDDDASGGAGGLAVGPGQQRRRTHGDDLWQHDNV